MAHDALSRKKIIPPQGSVVTPKARVDAPANKAHGAAWRACGFPRQELQDSFPAAYEFRYFMDRRGRQHFNFRQHVWLDPAIQMAHTPIQTVALDTLAINLLTFVIHGCDCQAAVGFTSRRAIELIPYFCADCLLTSPPNAWVLPRTAIRAWAHSYRFIGRSHTVGAQKRAKAR